MQPEGVAIALALDDHDEPGLARRGQPVQTVEANARSLAPTEAIRTLEGDPEPHPRIAAIMVKIRDADRRRPLITDFPQTVRQQEIERQPLGLGIVGEPATSGCCAVAALFRGDFD